MVRRLRKEKPNRPFLTVFLALTIVAVTATFRIEARENSGAQETSFSLTRLPEDSKQYSLVISGADERTISGAFSVDRLQILRAMMIEAEKFGFSPEGAGVKEPITTRFMDQQERAFIIDVQKFGNESLFFLTIETEIGRSTIEAGRIVRTTRREEGFFFDLLTRLQSTLPKLPSQPPKKTSPSSIGH